MRAMDVMQTKVATATSDLSLAGLEELLVRNGVSGVPVVSGGELCGVVSRSDVVRVLAEAQGDAEATLAYYRDVADGEIDASSAVRSAGERVARMTVEDVMTRELIVAATDASIREVARTMVTRGVHRVLVTEGRRLLGIVATLDLVRAIADGRL